MSIEIDATLKTQLKEQRLRNLSAQWYEQEMTRVACEANGRTQQAAEATKLQQEIEVSYQAIAEMN
ncbi:hypothetical protein [Paenibacillus sp. YN15]|uniref:hypothetical protein n=1 Tax=Paenibacillus sp. YN15 TaxID=1742774 RepID=UPI000DCE0D02|nr:hypothetical protein [Paenibacillus sp. YN15]RAV05422.1 hypothetical protein DQG13_02015 [Paenibacillus sp. YN15]